MNILRFTTAGSVDDGKSTLIGRLLYDSKSVYIDQVESIEKTSKRKGLDRIDFSLLMTGSRTNASKASPLMWPTGTLPHP